MFIKMFKLMCYEGRLTKNFINFSSLAKSQIKIENFEQSGNQKIVYLGIPTNTIEIAFYGTKTPKSILITSIICNKDSKPNAFRAIQESNIAIDVIVTDNLHSFANEYRDNQKFHIQTFKDIRALTQYNLILRNQK